MCAEICVCVGAVIGASNWWHFLGRVLHRPLKRPTVKQCLGAVSLSYFQHNIHTQTNGWAKESANNFIHIYVYECCKSCHRRYSNATCRKGSAIGSTSLRIFVFVFFFFVGWSSFWLQWFSSLKVCLLRLCLLSSASRVSSMPPLRAQVKVWRSSIGPGAAAQL